MPSKAQIKKIHTLLSRLDIDDATYREMLRTLYGVSTSKALPFNLARSLIARLERSAGITCGWRMLRYPKRFDNLGIREGMATPKQLRHIEGLWFDVTRKGTRAEGLAALREFLRNRFAITGIEAVREDDVTAVLTALKDMKKRKLTGMDEPPQVAAETKKRAPRKSVKSKPPVDADDGKIIELAAYLKGA
jgi:hypothetical protein